MPAFIHRINQGGGDRSYIEVALEQNFISIGWSNVEGLLDDFDWEQVREIIRDLYYPDDENLQRAGAATGHLWRFVQDMAVEDFVVVPNPHGYDFYVARVISDAYYDEEKVDNDSAYRRNVQWLNQGQAIPRRNASAALQQCMKTYSTSAYATDLDGDIAMCLQHAEAGDNLDFVETLRRHLVDKTLLRLQEGELNDYDFELLVETVLKRLGAIKSRIVPRNQDIGIDLTAEFMVGGAIKVVVGVQCKHWRPEPPVESDVVQQLTHAIENCENNVTHGMVVTTGTFSKDAESCAEGYSNTNNVSIQLIDGQQLAALIVDNGIKVLA